MVAKLLALNLKVDHSKSGEYWAPRGPSKHSLHFISAETDMGVGDIGTAEPVLGKDLSTSWQLPW